jgi:hypothetical protein
MSVNGVRVGEFPLAERLADLRVRLPASILHREANEVQLVPTSPQAFVERVVFTRPTKGGS